MPAAPFSSRYAQATVLFRSIAIFTVMVVFAMVSGIGGAVTTRLIALLAGIPVELVVVVLFSLAAHSTPRGPSRRAWWFLAAGFAFDFIGNVLGLPALLRNEDPYYAATLNTLYITFDVCILIGTVHMLHAVKRSLPIPQLALDAAMLLLGFGGFFWFLVVRPTATPGDSSMPILTQVYTALNCLIILMLDLSLLHSADRRKRRAAALLLVGFLISFLADLMWALSEMHHDYIPGTFQDTVYALSYIPLAAAAMEHLSANQANTAASFEFDKVARTVPYLPIAGAVLCLAYLARTAISGPAIVIAIILFVMTILFIARQGFALREHTAVRTRRAALLAEQRYTSIIANASDAFIVVNQARVIQLASPACQRLFGVPHAALVGKAADDLWPPAYRADLQAFVGKVEGQRTGNVGPFTFAREGDTHSLIIEVVGTNLVEDPAVQGMALTFRDISERKRLERRLRKLAYRDPLTGLSNRHRFRRRVDAAMDRVKRGDGQFAVLFLDLDDFKRINDSLGHDVGDRLLQEVAGRLSQCSTKVDTVARLGGDEFAILVRLRGAHGEAEERAATLLASLKAPLYIFGTALHVAGSIGITIANAGCDGESLLAQADMAMYQAKGSGKNRVVAFEQGMHNRLQERIRLEADITRALINDEFFVEYQPIVDLGTRCLLGVEALTRWRDPGRGTVMPGNFIPIMEESGQIVDLGRWVLIRACGELCAWRDAIPGGRQLRVSVNISAKHLQTGTLTQDITAALQASGLEPGNLVIELTESTIMSDTELNFALLTNVKRLGVHLAIDDFGTGYSSLAYLHRFPIDILKIDRSFVTRLSQSDNGRELAQAVISLGDSLGIDTVAEGIEDESQIQALLALGCVAGQGFVFARPGSFDQLSTSDFVARRRIHWAGRASQEIFSATGRFAALAPERQGSSTR